MKDKVHQTQRYEAIFWRQGSFNHYVWFKNNKNRQ